MFGNVRPICHCYLILLKLLAIKLYVIICVEGNLKGLMPAHLSSNVMVNRQAGVSGTPVKSAGNCTCFYEHRLSH